MTPGDRMILAHLAPLVAGFVQGEQNLNLPSGVSAKVVPLVGHRPGRVGKTLGRRVISIFDLQSCRLHGRVAFEIGSY